MSHKLYKLICLIILLSIAPFAYADAGLPMIIYVMPTMAFLLVPIIGIEAFVLLKYLNIKFSNAIYASSVGNVVSTIVGIPLTWGILLILQILSGGDGAYGDVLWWQKLIAVTWQAPWLVPYEKQFYWMIPVSMAFLMIPFFFISWIIEGYFIEKIVVAKVKEKAFKAALYSNLASYIFIEVGILAVLLKNLLMLKS